MSLTSNENSFGFTITVNNYVLKIDKPSDLYKFTLVKSTVGHFQHIMVQTFNDLTDGILDMLAEIFKLIKEDENRQKRRGTM